MKEFVITAPDGRRFRVRGETAEGALAAVRRMAAPAEGPGVGGTAADMAKAGAAGIARGAAGLVGLPGLLGDLGRKGLEWGMRKGYGAVAGQEPDPRSESGVERFFAGPTDEVRAAMPLEGRNPLASSVLNDALSSVTGGATDFRGETTAGKYAGTVGEFLPGAVAFGGMNPGNLARFGVLPGTASEAAGQATEGTAWETPARIAGGLLGTMVPAAVGRAVTPFPASGRRSAMVKRLKDEGVDVSAGQATGSRGLKNIESELAPDAAIFERQAEQFTSAALRKAGVRANRATPDVVDEAFEKIGRRFDDLAAKTTVPFDGKLQDDLLGIVTDYQATAGTAAPVVERVMNRAAELAKGGRLDGRAYANLRSEIGRMTKMADPQARIALREMQMKLDDAVGRHMTPGDALSAWQRARKEYRNLLTIEDAATRAGESAAMGLISPSALRGAVIKGNRKGYARGKDELGELARAGESVMRAPPNSGTAARLGARGLPVAIGGGAGSAIGGVPGGAIGAIAGLLFPKMMGKAVTSAPVRRYLGNQALRPGRALDPRLTGTMATMGALNLSP
jgi:hypothetical protein